MRLSSFMALSLRLSSYMARSRGHHVSWPCVFSDVKYKGLSWSLQLSNSITKNLRFGHSVSCPAGILCQSCDMHAFAW